MNKQHKVLIANRGEIAVRIIQACIKLGLDFVCVYTAEDASSGHVLLAREVGGEKSLYRISSYHDANELLSVADESGATAVHPGYGFFAEDFRFARRVTERERPLVFLGPSWRVIRDLGDKINTKRLARSLGVPTVPGSDRPIYDELEAEKIARSLFDFQMQQGIARPLVLVKASAGGGGMGIEEVYDIDMFRQVYRRIRNYAMRQFKDEGVLIEQRIKDFNHLEVQVLSDRTGRHPVHFGTRNCSIQSTGRQKRLEVAPGFDPSSIKYDFDAAALLDEIVMHSLNMARKVGYDSVGTWEWIVTRDGQPFLMEVNTRIQVENGVSAAISRREGAGSRSRLPNRDAPVSVSLARSTRRTTSPSTAWAWNTASLPRIPTTASPPGWATSTASAGKSTNGAAFTRMCLRPRPSIPTPFPPSSIPTWRWPSSGARILPR